MTFTRRQLLHTLGASAAPLLIPYLSACGPGSESLQRPLQPISRPILELRAELRALIADLSQRLPNATALATIQRAGATWVDTGERILGRHVLTSLVLSASNGSRAFEQTSSDLSTVGILRAGKALRDQAAAGYQAARPPLALASPRDHAIPLAQDPRQVPMSEWLERTGALHEQARRVGGSRVVYRAAYTLVDDSDVLFIGRGQDLSQRLVRTRAGVVLVVENSSLAGTAAVAELAENAGTMGLEAMEVPAAALEAAAERALSIVSPVPPPSGEMDMLLDPSMSARITRECIAPALDGQRWASGESPAPPHQGTMLGSSVVTLVDDPAAPGGYGSYFFDDEGVPAQARTLIDAGRLIGPLTDRRSAAVLGAPLTGNGRRPRPAAGIVPQASNLALAGSSEHRDALVAQIERGLLLEGALAASMDAQGWRMSARAARARQIIKGKITGVLYGAVDVRASVPALLGAVRAVAAAPVAWVSSHGDGAPASSAGPFMLTRAMVRGG